MALASPRQTPKPGVLKDKPTFSFFVELFKRMNKERDLQNLEAAGGVRDLALAIGVDVNFGIDTSPHGQEMFSLQHREEVFGKNSLGRLRPRKPTFEYTKRLLKKHILTPYVISGIISTILGLSFKEEREDSGWIVPTGIWTIAFLFILSGLAMDFQEFWMQEKTSHKKDVFDVTVLRDGKEQRIKNLELLVGDILLLTTGDIVAADGVLFMNNDLFMNEEVVTGESTPIRKKMVEDPFCRSGSQVTNGSGRILVTGVGEESEFGQTMKMVTESTDDEKEEWKDVIMYLSRNFIPDALCLGVLVFIIMLIRWMVEKNGFPVNDINDEGPVQFLILAIVIIVPELRTGYLLFAHFGLLYVTKKCAKDNIIIRKPNKLLWKMPDVSTICFDKTGTLTENKMTVVKGWFQGSYFERAPKSGELDPLALDLITENASLNSEAFFNIDKNRNIQLVGNQTEYALLIMTEKLGVDYSEVRLNKRQLIIKNYGFNSDKKLSSVIIRNGDLLRLYNKGAAEMVLNNCTKCTDSLGSKNPISEDKRIELENTIKTMASQGLRTLALSYVDLDLNHFNFSENGEPLDESEGDRRGFAEAPEENLVLLAIVGIKDPIRKGVSEVVKQFKKAGIFPRMITGDSLESAKQVARECGILTSNGLAMEGKEFRQRVEEDRVWGMPLEIQVLARSSPSDKQKLVELDSRNRCVAVCGDGTNDARAMKEADIGIALGTNSTEIAREAADVVVLNDNISSILTLYLWSQRLDLSLCEYFQFRLSVTLVVWIVVLVFVCVGGETPLSVNQFFWANFIIDTLIVLAFATERPPLRVPDDDSYEARKDAVDGSYKVHIFFQSLYQIIVMICTFYSLSSLFERYEAPAKDAFYYHYCCEDPTRSTGYRDSPVGPFCDQYLNCSLSTKSCTLFEEHSLDEAGLDYDFRNHIIDEYEDEHDLVKMRKNSLIFNIFVFMQLFNSLNCRTMFEDYNIFEGLFNSYLSLSIRLVTIGLQLMVMLTPMRTVFKVIELNAWEWLYSICISVMVIPLGTFIRFDAKKKALIWNHVLSLSLMLSIVFLRTKRNVRPVNSVESRLGSYSFHIFCTLRS